MAKRILIVEDTKDLLTNMEELFLMESFEVWTAANGKQGLEIIEDAKPDLIITDLLMPLLDGFEFIKQVRAQAQWSTIPIVVFSAMPAQENEEKVMKLGVNYYLKKPSTLDDLLKAVNRLINHEK